MLMIVHQVLGSRLDKWNHIDYRQVEVALLLVYMLAEALPVSLLQFMIHPHCLVTIFSPFICPCCVLVNRRLSTMLNCKHHVSFGER